AEQEQGDRRNKAGALAVDVAPRQFARLPRQQRDSAEDLAFEVKDAVREIVEESGKHAVDVRMLPAFMTVGTAQWRAAIEADGLGRMSVGRLARVWLDRAADHSAG